MNTYELNQMVTLSVNFTQESNGLPIDPSEVDLYVQKPDGTVVNHSTTEFAHDRTGHYSLNVILDKSGAWTYRWQAVGAVQASTADIPIQVNESNLVIG